MENIEIINIVNPDESVTQYVKIDRGNGEFTTMLKSYWDEQQKAAELGGTL